MFICKRKKNRCGAKTSVLFFALSHILYILHITLTTAWKWDYNNGSHLKCKLLQML